MKNTQTNVLLAIVFVALLFLAVGGTNKSFASTTGESINFFFKTATSSKETVSSTVSTQLLATSTSRSWAIVSNNSAFPVFCTENGALATNGGGILVVASSTWSISGVNGYQGALNCIAQGSAASVWVEAVQ